MRYIYSSARPPGSHDPSAGGVGSTWNIARHPGPPVVDGSPVRSEIPCPPWLPAPPAPAPNRRPVPVPPRSVTHAVREHVSWPWSPWRSVASRSSRGVATSPRMPVRIPPRWSRLWCRARRRTRARPRGRRRRRPRSRRSSRPRAADRRDRGGTRADRTRTSVASRTARRCRTPTAAACGAGKRRPRPTCRPPTAARRDGSRMPGPARATASRSR